MIKKKQKNKYFYSFRSTKTYDLSCFFFIALFFFTNLQCAHLSSSQFSIYFRDKIKSQSARQLASQRFSQPIGQPAYESCQDVDLSSLAQQEQTEASFCFNCSPELGSSFEELVVSFSKLSSQDYEKKRKIQVEIENRKEVLNQNEEDFKQKLQDRVIGWLEYKLEQARTMKACSSKDSEEWLKNKTTKNNQIFESLTDEERYQIAPAFEVLQNFSRSGSASWFGVPINFEMRAKHS